MADKEIKKRKRLSNGVEPPSKKVQRPNADGTSGTIKVTYSEGQGLAPVLLSTPGLNAPTIRFKAYSKPLSTRNANPTTLRPTTHSLLLQSSEHPRLDYTASPAAIDPHLSHYVAVFDAETNTLQIAPAHHLSLRGTLRSDAQEVEDENARSSYAQQRENLGREFGTKKAKKAIASRTDNAITKGSKGKDKISDVQAAILDNVADSTAGTLQKQEQADAQLAAKPIPRPNLEAEDVEDVYPINTLIPPGDMRLVTVKDWQDKIRANEELMFSYRYPAFRFRKFGSDDDVLKLKALRYLTCLLDFYSALQNAGRAGKKVPKKEVLQKKMADYPEALVDSVRRRFSENNELPKWHQDNLCTHICALSLYIDNFVTEISSVRDDMKMENKDLQQYYSELGCKVSAPTEPERTRFGLVKAAAAATRVARLKLPLEFPKPRGMRKR